MRLSSLITMRTFYLAVLLLFIACCSSFTYAYERLTISIVTYRGNNEDVRLFQAQLSNCILTLPELLPSMADADYLRHLKALERNDDFSSAAERDAYWKQGDALQIFFGTISLESSHRYFVRSNIYFGDLQGSLPHKTLSLEVPFSVRNVADTLDIHTAVILYGLAMDAGKASPRKKDLIANLLKVAKDKLIDIRNRKNLSFAIDSPLFELEQAIDTTAKELRSKP